MAGSPAVGKLPVTGRVNADIGPKAKRALEAIAAAEGISLSEALRRAVTAYAWVVEKQASEAEVFVKQPGAEHATRVEFVL